MSPGSNGWVKWVPLLLGPFAASCLVGDDRCGKNQDELSEGLFGVCVCAEGTVPSANNKGCEPCSGAFEVAQNGMCQCVAGYSKSAGVCMPAMPVVDSGAPAEGGTSPGRLTGTTGQGDPCADQSGCAGKDASYCMVIAKLGGMMPTCLVQDCGNNGSRSCASDRVCCDMSGLSGVEPSLATNNGLCLPMGGCTNGTVVMP